MYIEITLDGKVLNMKALLINEYLAFTNLMLIIINQGLFDDDIGYFDGF